MTDTTTLPQAAENNQLGPLMDRILMRGRLGSLTALREAVNAIYFNDSSDYLSALWSVVRELDPAMADLLEQDEKAAYDKTRANVAAVEAVTVTGDISTFLVRNGMPEEAEAQNKWLREALMFAYRGMAVQMEAGLATQKDNWLYRYHLEQANAVIDALVAAIDPVIGSADGLIQTRLVHTEDFDSGYGLCLREYLTPLRRALAQAQTHVAKREEAPQWLDPAVELPKQSSAEPHLSIAVVCWAEGWAYPVVGRYHYAEQTWDTPNGPNVEKWSPALPVPPERNA